MKGVPIRVAPLIRPIAVHAYKVGARLVDVIWNDEQIDIARLKYATRDSFDEYPAWRINGALEYAKRGDARLVVLAQDPELFVNQDPELVAIIQKTAARHCRPIADYIVRNAMNWLTMSAPIPAWAAKVYPGVPVEAQEAKLWDTIFEICRVKKNDPISSWKDHVRQLESRSRYLNMKKYTAMKLTAPGTDLTVGLPEGHIWRSASMKSQNDIAFTANIPTEEVFTIPHKDRTEGVVTATRPLTKGGTLVKKLKLIFAKGRVVEETACQGEAALHKLLDTDEGVYRFGEVVLVPHSSPISQTGLLFYNTIIDENAASHVAMLPSAGLSSLTSGAVSRCPTMSFPRPVAIIAWFMLI